VTEHTNNTTQKVALVNSTTHNKKSRLRDRAGLVALYDIRPGDGAGLFLQARSRERG